MAGSSGTSLTNISATISDFVGRVSTDDQEKTMFRKVQYKNVRVETFTDTDSDDDTFYPKKLREVVYFKTINKAGVEQPSFITDASWLKVKNMSSGFISAAGTLVPRIVFPTKQLTANGIGTNGTTDPNVVPSGYFNWQIDKEMSASGLQAVVATEPFLFGKRNSISDEFSFVTCDAVKNGLDDDSDGIKTRAYKLSGTSGTSGSTDNFDFPLIGKEKGGAACAFVYGFSKVEAAKVDEAGDEVKDVASVEVDMGDNIKISVDQSGALNVDMNSVRTNGSLVPSTTSVRPRQQQTIPSANTMLVYPVWNGIVLSSGVQDSKNLVEVGNMYVTKTVDTNISDNCSPTFEEYPLDAPEDIIVSYPDAVRTDWGSFVRLIWRNSLGNFCYVPAFFSKKCQWSYIFRDRISEEDSGGTGGTDGTGGTSGTASLTLNDYVYEAYNIYSDNDSKMKLTIDAGSSGTSNFGFSGTSNSVKAKFIEGSEQTDGTGYYRFDFTIEPDPGTSGTSGTGSNGTSYWPRRCLETWGFIMATTEKQFNSRKQKIKNGNGTFSLTPSGGAVEGLEWYEYITDISVNLTLEGCSGQLNLDKYAMLGQDGEVEQSIGGITIEMTGGNPSVITTGTIFNGIAMEIQESLSAESDSLTVSLYGLEKKLSDMKLVNAPFWDGDELGDVADWLSSYGGIEISFNAPLGSSGGGGSAGDRTTPLPRSVDFEKPAINFPMGTSVLDALQKIASLTNHTFIIQADGIGYYYQNSDDGIPNIVYTSTEHTFTSKDVINVNKQPVYSNMYNAYLTVGLISVINNATVGSKASPLDTNVMPGFIYENKVTEPDYPWARIMVSGEQGYVTPTDLEDFHNRNVKLGSHYMMTGGITIPGNADIKILDRIKIDDSGTGGSSGTSGEKTLYVHAITHNISFQSGEWTTTLQVASAPAQT